MASTSVGTLGLLVIQKSGVNKGVIPPFSEAIKARLIEITNDLDIIKNLYGGGYPEFISGSSLDLLKSLPTDSVDMVITSPPYANRYDYTRTYALELAWLGFRPP